MDHEDDVKTTTSETLPVFSFRDIDEETIALLVDDKIATGG